MTSHTSIHPFEIDTLARTRVTAPAPSPAVQLGNATLFMLWHGWQAFRRAVHEFFLARRVSRERRVLAGLTSLELRDIGLDHATADRESARGFLDIPVARRR